MKWLLLSAPALLALRAAARPGAPWDERKLGKNNQCEKNADCAAMDKCQAADGKNACKCKKNKCKKKKSAAGKFCLLPKNGSATMNLSSTGVSWVDQDLKDSDGNIVGTNSGECSLLPQSTTALQCHGTFLIDGDIVMLQGMADMSTGRGTFGVAGGTGCYEGATGGYVFQGNTNVSAVFTFTLM